MTARIATIIPTFNRQALLGRAVDSVLAQDVSVSIRVFDNASTDGTEQMMRSLAASDESVRYHRHASNIGGAANFEFGLTTVDTEFFSILSDDDYLLPAFYQEAIRALDADPEALFWAGCTLHVDESDVVVEARIETWARYGRFIGEEGVMAMTHGRAPTWTGIVFRRRVLERLGLPDRDARGPSDLDFVLRAAAHGPFIVSPHPSAVFILNSASFSATQPLSSFWPGWLHMIANVRRWAVFDATSRERIAAALETDARRMLFRRGIAAVLAGRRDFAKEAALILRDTPRGRMAGLLLGMTFVATRYPGVVAVLARLYARLETRLISQRNDLQRRHGGRLRSVARG